MAMKLFMIPILFLIACTSHSDPIEEYAKKSSSGTYYMKVNNKPQFKKQINFLKENKISIAEFQNEMLKGKREALPQLIENLDDLTKIKNADYFNTKIVGIQLAGEVDAPPISVSVVCFDSIFRIIFEDRLEEGTDRLAKLVIRQLYEKKLMNAWFENRNTLATDELLFDLRNVYEE